MSGNFIYRHHVEPRVKLYSPREESFPFPTETHWRLQNSKNKFGCYARKPHRWLLEYRWIERFVRFLDRFHSVYSKKWETSRRIFMIPGGRVTKRQATSRPDHLWPELWSGMSKNAKLREKHKWAIEKRKLDNARRLRGIYFIDPVDMEFKEIIQNARRKLGKHQWLQPCLARQARTVSMRRPVARLMISSLNFHVSWTPRIHKDAYGRISTLYRNIMRTILQEKETIHCNITIMVHKFIPMPQAMKIPAAKAAVDKEWEKLEKILAWDTNKRQTQISGDRWSKDEGRKSSFCFTDGHLSFEERRLGDKEPKIQRSSCILRRHCERWFWILCSIYRTRIISITNDAPQK